MRSWPVLVISLALAGCDSPSLAFIGAPETRVIVDGTRFTVRRRGDRVEALRTSREALPSRSLTRARARRAIAAATGCDIVASGGDVSVELALIDC